MILSIRLSVCVLLLTLCLARADAGPGAEAATPPEPETPEVTFIKVSTQVKDLPDEIRTLDPAVDLLDPSLNYEVSFAMVNDSVYRPKGGTDDGYTHGVQLLGGIRLHNGIHLAVAYTTDLYTAPVPGDPSPTRNEKYFTNENLIRFIADNVGQDKAWYWKADGGWRRLSNDVNCNFFDASCQQIWFHNILNKLKTVSSPVDIEDGRGIQDSPFVGGASGFQQFSHLGPIGFINREELGAELSPVDGVSDIYGSYKVGATYVLKRGYRFEIGLGFLAKAHSQGIEYQPSIEARFDTSHWTVGAERTHYFGDIQNYVLYNLPSPNGKYDPILKVYVNYRFKR